MADISALTQSELDAHFLRQSFDVARRAMTHGNHPFGALLVDQQRQRPLELVVAGIDTLDEGAQAEQRIARLAVEAR